ncbi:GntR family transcriptional regulator [Nocardia rhamnosiphila]
MTKPSGPRYQQIATDLRERIERGDYAPGDKIPTKSELMTQWGVALNTVDRAVSELQKAGLIETHHGVGSFVRAVTEPEQDPAEQIAELRGRVTHLEEQLAAVYAHIGLTAPDTPSSAG